jgi:hypothetical protein
MDPKDLLLPVRFRVLVRFWRIARPTAMGAVTIARRERAKADLVCSRCVLKADLPELPPIRIQPVGPTLPEFTKEVA